ncbi:MAG: sensor histidine kinase [Saprospiraceae bacterium]
MNKINPYLGFNDIWVRIIGAPIIAFFIPILFFGDELFPLRDYLGDWLLSLFFTIGYWETSRGIMIYFRKRYPDFKDSRRRIILASICVIIGTKIVGTIIRTVAFSILAWIGLDDNLMHEQPFTATVFIYALIVTVVSIYESIYFYSQLQRTILEKEQAVQAQIRSQLQGLRAQVNPHFLFNSLNTLTGIVEEDQKLAVRFLNKMSKVYRYVLEFREETVIPLREELDFIQNYVFLQEERFRGKLQVEIDVPTASHSAQIVPLSMQILFENAIKHNIISKRKPLIIKVFIENNKLVVQNNLQRKSQVMGSTKVGLENIRKRYKLITESRVEVIETEEDFIVKVPLIGGQTLLSV